MRPTYFAALFLLACNSSAAAPGAATATPAVGAGDATATATNANKVVIRVTKEGFVPAEIKVPKGKPVVLEFTREVESECLNAVRMPWLADTVPLPMNKAVAIPFDAAKAGTLTYSCWMKMVFGKITVTET